MRTPPDEGQPALRLKGRRSFLRDLASLGAAAVAWQLLPGCAPAVPPAQPPTRLYRVGMLRTGTDPAGIFGERLAELGYIEGRNLRTETRGGVEADTDEEAQERIEQAARELAGIPVDVIVVKGGPAREAAVRATTSIPIVLMGAQLLPGVPVESIPRPGSNVTGVARPTANLYTKRLQLLLEAAPRTTRVLVLGGMPLVTEDDVAAGMASFGLAYQWVETVFARDDLEPLFAQAVADGVDGLVVGTGSVNGIWGQLVVELAQRYRLPAFYYSRSNVDRGGLMTYEPRDSEIQRYTAEVVDRILRGTPASEVPIQLASGYDLIVNLRAARAIGLILPQSFLSQADEVID